ncbi:MAG: alpha/beta fold hydrolase [bacterium]
MRAKNSTIVRFGILEFYRRGLALVSWVSTAWAAVLAERWFRRAPRRPDAEAELAILAGAQRLDLELDGRRLAAWKWGEGPLALLVHGWGGSAAQLTPWVAPLRRAGYAVVAFDAPAHGHSGGRLSSLPQFAAAIAGVAAHVGGVEVLVAHSMGGAAASLAMAGGLSLNRAVFLAPPADALEWWLKFSKQLRLSPKVAAAARSRMERRLRFRFDRLNAKVLGPFLRAPLLVIHDRGDAEVIWYDGAAIAAYALRGRLRITEGLGHRRILRDARVLAETLEFLRGDGDSTEVDREAKRLVCGACGEVMGADASSEDALCESCALERELFDKELRYARQSAQPAGQRV